MSVEGRLRSLDLRYERAFKTTSALQTRIDTLEKASTEAQRLTDAKIRALQREAALVHAPVDAAARARRARVIVGTLSGRNLWAAETAEVRTAASGVLEALGAPEQAGTALAMDAFHQLQISVIHAQRLERIVRSCLTDIDSEPPSVVSDTVITNPRTLLEWELATLLRRPAGEQGQAVADTDVLLVCAALAPWNVDTTDAKKELDEIAALLPPEQQAEAGRRAVHNPAQPPPLYQP